VITGKLAIEPGAKFSGTCSMNNVKLKEVKIPLTENVDRSQEKP
jgi:hypothetical protein